MNPEYGVFGVAKDTNEGTNPTALESIDQGTEADLHQHRLQREDPRGLVGGPHARAAGRRRRLAGLEGRPDRRPRADDDDSPWAHPNSRFTTTLDNVPNIADDYNAAAGVPIDAIIFGGRTRDREPLIRAINDLAEGVYDGLTLGAEATFAAEGNEGVLRYDPMSNRPFMAYGEGDYAAHYLKIVGAAQGAADLRPRELVPARPRGRPLPVARLPRQPAPAALAAAAQERRGQGPPDRRSASSRPQEELNLEGVDITPEDLETILSIDVPRWRQEMGYREEHLKQFDNLPEEIWEAHRRVAAALDE